MATAPLGVRLRRGWRRLRGGGSWGQLLALLLAATLVADIVALAVHTGSKSHTPASGAGTTTAPGVVGPSGSSAAGTGSSGGTGAASSPGAGSTSGATGGVGGVGALPGGQGAGASTTRCPPLAASDRGVTPSSIRVVFPWPNLSTVEAAFSFSSSGEDDVTSIRTFVDDINAKGGINCRRIDAEIVSYDPTNDADMKAKCQQWTQVEKVFAVVDAFAWHDDNQLCITQQGHTPLISGWTSVDHQLQEGAPFLWWTATEQVAALGNLVAWARGAGVLTAKTKFGIVYTDRSTDTIVRQQFGALLARAGLSPADVETMHFSATDQSQAEAQGAIAVHNLQAKGVTVVFPLIPFTTYAVYLANENSQSYYPKLLLSDFENTVGGSLGLLDSGAFDKALDNQLGTTDEVLGNTDGPRGTAPNSPGYNPQTLDCWKVWVAHNPHYQGANGNPYHGYIESTGVAAGWCQNIRLFAAAARLAGPNLTRDAFTAAMSHLSSFPGTLVPDLRYAPGHYWGPHLFRVVEVHKNSDNKCPPKEYDNTPMGTCWILLHDFAPMLQI